MAVEKLESEHHHSNPTALLARDFFLVASTITTIFFY